MGRDPLNDPGDLARESRAYAKGVRTFVRRLGKTRGPPPPVSPGEILALSSRRDAYQDRVFRKRHAP